MRALSITNVTGLPETEAGILNELARIYNNHLEANRKKNRYYEGHIRLDEVNLDIALPDGFQGLEIGCEWGAKCVDVLAARSMFDGFVGKNGDDAEAINRIFESNNLEAQYMKAVKDELKFGSSFATLSKEGTDGCRIRFHSPMTASAIWDGERGGISAGLVIVDMGVDEAMMTYSPKRVNLYTDSAVWELSSMDGQRWTAIKKPHSMGRPLMEPMTWNATSLKPFGRSRIKEPVRRLIDGYVRTIANATIGLEFSTTPQKYLLGLTDEQYDAVVNQKFKQYIGSIIASTTNPETGEKPTFGQLSQGTIEPHVQMIRLLATQFSAATGLTVTDVGVINDANPTSSDAILAQSQTLVLLAEQLNAGNSESLYKIAQMAQAIAAHKTLDELDEAERSITPHFKNPAMPSVAVTADAAVKIAASRPEFASTDIYLEMVGFDQADIRRIKAQEQKARGLSVLGEIESEEPEEPVNETDSGILA